MKINKVLNNGMTNYAATLLWDKIEGYAAYSFNRSHSVEYSVISYWCMWLKVNYPAEFYAAAMTIIDDETKLASLMLDAKGRGLKILPPDINVSTDRLEINGDTELYAPFQAIKGISSNVAKKILEVKAFKNEPFTSMADFEQAVKDSGVGGKINKAHREKLERVGAFASIEPNTLPALHESRLKDRLEFMPGFTVEHVKADRGISNDRLAKISIMGLIGEVQNCANCSIKDNPHPSPRMGKSPKFMMVFDVPTYQEGQADKMLEGDMGDYVKAALKEVGLSVSDGYFTSLVKAVKSKGAKGLSNEQINGCSGYLKREIEILKPPIIIAMGAASVKYFVPSTSGSPADYSGKVIFNPELDASIILGVNPASLHFDPSKIKLVQDVCHTLSTLVQE
jgi:DNA polymerase III subunit alpha